MQRNTLTRTDVFRVKSFPCMRPPPSAAVDRNTIPDSAVSCPLVGCVEA